MENEFTGFTNESLEFLYYLKYHNTITEQKENIQKYKSLISIPLSSLYFSLLPTIEKISDRLETKKQRCVSSPYTDRRYSPRVPLKEYMYVKYRCRDLVKDIPCLYFDMRINSYSYGLFVGERTVAGMDKLRDRMLALPEKFSEQFEKLSAKGIRVGGESYKKDRYPEFPDLPIKIILNKKNIFIGKEFSTGPEVKSFLLAKEITETFMSLSSMLGLIID